MNTNAFPPIPNGAPFDSAEFQRWINMVGKSGDWTPTDASGAALSFTTVDGSWYRIGGMCFAQATFTYPATASGANAVMGGLQFLFDNREAARTGILTYHSGATAVKILGNKNAATAGFYTAAGAAVTNAQMSGTVNYVQFIYPVV